MNYSKPAILWLIYCCFYCARITAAQNEKIAPGEIYKVKMTDFCSLHDLEQFPVDDCVELSLTSDTSSAMDLDCMVTFTSKPGFQLLLTFVQMDINPNDRWEIFDSKTNLGKFKKSGTFYNLENQKTEQPNVQRDYSSSEGVLTLHFDGKLNEKYTGFTAIITAYTKPVNGTCRSDQCSCRGRWICIAENLQCNGYRNCGTNDPSDEEQCIKLPDHNGYQDDPSNNSQNIGLLVGGTASIVVLMVIVLVLLGIVCLRRMARQSSYSREVRAPGDDIVVDADHVPPPPLCCRRHYPCPMHSNTFAEPPPPYSEHHQHRCVGQFDIPPYTPDGCDTAGLLNQSQGLSQDTPPAYRTLPPDFSSVANENATIQIDGHATTTNATSADTPHTGGQCGSIIVPPVADIINLGSDTSTTCDPTTATDLSVITCSLIPVHQNSAVNSHDILLPTSNQGLPLSQQLHAPQNPNLEGSKSEVSGNTNVTDQASLAPGQDLIMDSFPPNEPPIMTESTDGGEENEGRQTSTHFWRNPKTTPPFKRKK